MSKQENISICGIKCGICEHKLKGLCQGCRATEGTPFWGVCELYQCSKSKDVKHCGQCENFPCDTLKQWASSENPERIDNLHKLNKDEVE